MPFIVTVTELVPATAEEGERAVIVGLGFDEVIAEPLWQVSL